MLRARPYLALLLVGCGGARPDPGLDLNVRVVGAQLVRAAMPADQGGPAVTQVDVRVPRVYPGESRIPFTGRTAGTGHAVNIGRLGEDAYWILPVGVEEYSNPGELVWAALLDFSRELPAGPFQLAVQAVDGEGRAGAAQVGQLEALKVIPDGELVVTLEWDAQVDADLYVTDPFGSQIGPKNINTVSPAQPGAPQPPPDAWQKGGILDFDSNANCALDGRRRESAVWTQPAPRGRYLVHVDMPFGCGLPRTGYRVTVRVRGEVIQQVQGALQEADARASTLEPALSAGIRALEFQLP